MRNGPIVNTIIHDSFETAELNYNIKYYLQSEHMK